MPTSPALFDAMEPETSKFPSLPPIDLVQHRPEDAQIAAAKEELVRTTKIQRKLMKLKRNKVQQQQLQSLLYVFSSGLSVRFMNDSPIQTANK